VILKGWNISALELESLKAYCDGRPDFERNFLKRPRNLTNKLYDHLEKVRHTFKDKDHFKAICYGDSGTAKSFSMLTCASLLDKVGFEVKKQVHFDLDQALLNLDKLQEGQVFFIDEKKDKWGVGTTATGEEFDNFCEQCRDCSISVLACANTKHEFTYHYAFQGIPGFISEERQIARFALEKPTGQGNSYCLGYVEFLNPRKVLGDTAVLDYLDLKFQKGQERMHKKGSGVWDEMEQKVIEYIRPNNTESLIKRVIRERKRLSRGTLLEIINEALPFLNYDIRAQTLTDRILFKINTGALDLGVRQSEKVSLLADFT